jgi:hypothetical protein
MSQEENAVIPGGRGVMTVTPVFEGTGFIQGLPRTPVFTGAGLIRGRARPGIRENRGNLNHSGSPAKGGGG